MRDAVRRDDARAAPTACVRSRGGDRIDLGDRALDRRAHARPRVAPHRPARRAIGRDVHRRGDRLLPAVGAGASGPRCPRPRSTSRPRSRRSPRSRSRRPTALLTSHFGPVPDPDERASIARRSGSTPGRATWRDVLRDRPDASDVDTITARLSERAARRVRDATRARPFERAALRRARLDPDERAGARRGTGASAGNARPRRRAQPSAASRSAASNAAGSCRMTLRNSARGLVAPPGAWRGCRPARTTAAACSPPPRPRASSRARATPAPRRSARRRRAPTRRRSRPPPSPRSAPPRSRSTSSASGTASSGVPTPRRQSAIRWFWSVAARHALVGLELGERVLPAPHAVVRHPEHLADRGRSRRQRLGLLRLRERRRGGRRARAARSRGASRDNTSRCAVGSGGPADVLLDAREAASPASDGVPLGRAPARGCKDFGMAAPEG